MAVNIIADGILVISILYILYSCCMAEKRPLIGAAIGVVILTGAILFSALSAPNNALNEKRSETLSGASAEAQQVLIEHGVESDEADDVLAEITEILNR